MGMAMEHVEYGRGENMEGGWGNSSRARFHATCSWCPWSDTDVFSSTWDAASAGDADAADGWEKVSQSAESPGDGLDQAPKSAEDGEVDYPNSAADERVQASEFTGDGWNPAPKSSKGGWCDSGEAYCEFEKPSQAESALRCSGLVNLGNTCFMNAVLQCLTYTVPFVNRIMSNPHIFSCQTQGFCVMCAVQHHMKTVLAASGRVVSPSFLAHHVGQISRSFALGQQQDAHEFLLYLMDGMQKCCKSDGSHTTQAGDTNFVSDIFIGQMKSQVKCKTCTHCSDSVEPFLGLNLEIENCDSIKEALLNFLAVEELEEENKISCLHCKEVTRRSKQFSFSRSPQVLLIQLKRYKATELFPTKIERDVKYEMSLDLRPFISKGDESVLVQECDWKYGLYAVLVHSGWSTVSGHYYCYVQTSPGVWHCMNDSSVSRVSDWTVLHQEAYILFYMRESIKEELNFENTLPAELDPKASANSRSQTSKKVDPCLCHSPIEGESAYDNPSLPLDDEVQDPVIPSQAIVTKSLESSDLLLMEIEVKAPIARSQVKSPAVSKQVQRDSNMPCVRKPVQRDTNISVPLQQSSRKPLFPPKDGSLHELREPKPSPFVKVHSSLKAEKTSNPSLQSGGNKVVLDSFDNGSQHSLLRLLNKMPSTRRQALLASALSGQEAMKQSSPMAKSVKDKSKPANTIKLVQGGSTKGTYSLSSDAEQDIQRSPILRDKPWTEYDHTGGRKLQRVGGKRVMASFRNSDAHYQQLHAVAKANLV